MSDTFFTEFIILAGVVVQYLHFY